MGSFAETTNFDYRLSFADQGKQTSVFVFSIQTDGAVFRVYIYKYIETAACI
jgi:hypothetical protein